LGTLSPCDRLEGFRQLSENPGRHVTENAEAERSGKRLGRRLPISQQTASAIRDWQRVRANVLIADASADYLFPARSSAAPIPHLRTQTVGDALRIWAAWINDNVVLPTGQTRPLEGVSVYAHAFRHFAMPNVMPMQEYRSTSYGI
jgi:integrase